MDFNNHYTQVIYNFHTVTFCLLQHNKKKNTRILVVIMSGKPTLGKIKRKHGGFWGDSEKLKSYFYKKLL